MKTKILNNGIALGLMKEFKSNDLNFCLKIIGVLKQNEYIISYSDITNWERGGAETYNATATVKTNNNKHKFIAKALISMATKPEQKLIDWVTRRQLISSLGIKTPILYSASNGIVYEEFIDYEFVISDELNTNILKQVAFIGAVLDKNGFTAISFDRDIRVMNNELYYVDFGSDLGNPSAKIKNSALDTILKKFSNTQQEFIIPIYNRIIYN